MVVACDICQKKPVQEKKKKRKKQKKKRHIAWLINGDKVNEVGGKANNFHQEHEYHRFSESYGLAELPA